MQVYAVASEDMDTLTFAAPKMARNLWSGGDKPIQEFTHSKARRRRRRCAMLSAWHKRCARMFARKVLEELGITQEQFVDVCILSGCDYCDTIRGVGPTKALQFVKDHNDIEGVVAHLRRLDKAAYVIPDVFPFEEARLLFLKPEVIDVASLPELKARAHAARPRVARAERKRHAVDPSGRGGRGGVHGQGEDLQRGARPQGAVRAMAAAALGWRGPACQALRWGPAALTRDRRWRRSGPRRARLRRAVWRASLGLPPPCTAPSARHVPASPAFCTQRISEPPQRVRPCNSYSDAGCSGARA